MVEGGSSILSTFLAADLVDELIVYLAPTLLGSGTPALNDLGITTLADAQHWSWDEAGGGAVRILGNDLRLHLRSPEGPPALSRIRFRRRIWLHTVKLRNMSREDTDVYGNRC